MTKEDLENEIEGVLAFLAPQRQAFLSCKTRSSGLSHRPQADKLLGGQLDPNGQAGAAVHAYISFSIL